MKKKYIIQNTVIVFILLFLFTFFINFKISFHNDEYLSYMIANNEWTFRYSEGDFVKAQDIITNNLATHNDNLFNFKAAYDTTAKDTHPFLYYFLLNFVCSLFPSYFSKWLGLSINMIFGIILFFVLRKIINQNIINNKNATILTFTFIFSSAFINLLSCTRMYMLSTLWVVLLEYNLLKNFQNNNTNFKKLILQKIILFLIIYLGALTQYHFLFIAAIMIFIDIIFNIYTKKTFLHSIRNAIISLIAVICAYFTFPAMLRHLLTGQHGLQTIEEGRVMAEQKGFVDGFIGFFNFLNKDIFGYSLIVIIPLIILLVIIKKINNKSNKSNLFSINEKYFICINLFTSFIFIIILSATTKFNAIRYLFPIYPLLFLIVYFLLNYFVKNQKGLIKYFAIISAILISILSLIHEPYYLYRRDKQYLEYFESNSNIPVVMVFDKKSITRTVNTFSMIKNNDKVMIIEKDHLQFLQDEYLIDKPYYLFIINFVDVNNVFNYIKNIRKDYKEPQHIYMDQYLSCFYIS